jgi:hypothetical protein
MYATVDESQTAMRVDFSPRIFGRRGKMAQKFVHLMLVASFAAALGGTAAFAQNPQPAPAQQTPMPAAPNPFRAVTDFIGWTTETGAAPDFIRQTRPDADKMDYSHLTGVDKPRVPVKTPEQVEADKAALIGTRDKADARRKKLQGEKLEAVAPNKAPPAEPF